MATIKPFPMFLKRLAILLTSSLLLTACMQVAVTWFFPPPSNLFSRIHVEETVAFPGAVFDFWSVDLEFVEVDGRTLQHSYPLEGYPLEGDQVYETMKVVNLAPGSHSLGVRAVKGPMGYFGRAPFARCKATIEFIAEPGTQYKVRFSRAKEPHSVELVNVSTNEVVCDAPCIQCSFFDSACKELAK